MAKKNKTIKSLRKRFRVTKNGKVLKVYDGQNHLNAKKSGKTIRRKRRPARLAAVDAKVIRKLLS